MILFENDSRSAAFFFAAEEYIMCVLKPQVPALMLWITNDVVMLGVNQIAKAECDLAYASEAGIEVVRRPSGGGTIFTDCGTLQYTVIVPYSDKTDVKDVVRDWLVEPLTHTLTNYGITSSYEGRNDVVIDGRKISGTAQHIREGYICSHGSLLFNTNLERLARVLTVDREKIQTKAVASVSARVTKIIDHISAEKRGASPAALHEFKEAFIESYGEKNPVLRRSFTPEELREIEKTKSARYASSEWTFGRDPAFTFTNKKRFPGGGLEVFLDVKGGVIQSVKITGDFLALRPIEEIEKSLNGVPHKEESLAAALRSFDVSAVLGSITNEELLSVLV